MREIVKITDLVKYYYVGENVVKAVDHTNLEIERGKFTAIVGRSGSGKWKTIAGRWNHRRRWVSCFLMGKRTWNVQYQKLSLSSGSNPYYDYSACVGSGYHGISDWEVSEKGFFD